MAEKASGSRKRKKVTPKQTPPIEFGTPSLLAIQPSETNFPIPLAIQTPMPTPQEQPPGPSDPSVEEEEEEEEDETVLIKKKRKKIPVDWGESLKTRRCICERGIEQDSAMINLRSVATWLEKRGIFKWFDYDQRFLRSVCVEFYKNCREVSSERLESTVRKKLIVVTPDIVAEFLACPRPDPDNIQFPRTGYTSLTGQELANEMCVDPTKYHGVKDCPVGNLKRDYALFNKIWQSNIRPSGKEKHPSVNELQWFYEMKKGTVVDLPFVIWDRMKRFVVGKNVQAGIPSCWMITCLAEKVGITKRSGENFEYPTPGRITSQTEKQIRSHTSGPGIVREDAPPPPTTSSATPSAPIPPVSDMPTTRTDLPPRTILRSDVPHVEEGTSSGAPVQDLSGVLLDIFAALGRIEARQEDYEKKQKEVEKEGEEEKKRRHEVEKAFVFQISHLVMRQDIINRKIGSSVVLMRAMDRRIAEILSVSGIPTSVPPPPSGKLPVTEILTALGNPLSPMPIPIALKDVVSELGVPTSAGHGERATPSSLPHAPPLSSTEVSESVAAVATAPSTRLAEIVIPFPTPVHARAELPTPAAIDAIVMSAAPSVVATVVTTSATEVGSSSDVVLPGEGTDVIMEEADHSSGSGGQLDMPSSDEDSEEEEEDSEREDSVEREIREEMEKTEEIERLERERLLGDDVRDPDYDPTRDD